MNLGFNTRATFLASCATQPCKDTIHSSHPIHTHTLRSLLFSLDHSKTMAMNLMSSLFIISYSLFILCLHFSSSLAIRPAGPIQDKNACNCNFCPASQPLGRKTKTASVGSAHHLLAGAVGRLMTSLLRMKTKIGSVGSAHRLLEGVVGHLTTSVLGRKLKTPASVGRTQGL
ncbi:hypothetical protein AQUCO_04900173v1 [Aquilegia coerulea]|uniref:Uncharacterized protein n=1 Tax=Aquilegia coerulea TaxID=218851 RepID=A0A2G5CK89_AQUCA|nr:hypothetical protein AQUCO_04900173v1 [Aquilegia coerulea]